MRHLRAVPSEMTEAEQDALVSEAMSHWTPGQRECRARRHHLWKPSTVFDHKGSGQRWYEVTERCPSCKNRRRRGMDLAGHWMDRWKIYYEQGYLLPKGAGGVSEDQSARLRLASIRSRRIVEVQDAS